MQVNQFLIQSAMVVYILTRSVKKFQGHDVNRLVVRKRKRNTVGSVLTETNTIVDTSQQHLGKIILSA